MTIKTSTTAPALITLLPLIQSIAFGPHGSFSACLHFENEELEMRKSLLTARTLSVAEEWKGETCESKSSALLSLLGELELMGLELKAKCLMNRSQQIYD